jgi:hypothetical protein
LGAVGAIVLLFVLTNRWPGIDAPPHALADPDVQSYRAIAAAAPHLPHAKVGSAYAYRFGFNYVVGLLAHVPGVSLTLAYRLAWIACFTAIVLVARRLFSSAGLSPAAQAVCLGALVLNPFAFRYYAADPGFVADMAFELGLVILLLGLVERRARVVLFGVAVATVARQTGLFVGPAAAVWVMWGPGWSALPRRRRLQVAALCVFLPVGLYCALSLFVRRFSYHFSPRIFGDTLLPWLEHPSGRVGAIANHVLHCASPLVLVSALAVALLVGARRADPHWWPPVSFWAALVIAAAVDAQPLLITPEFPGFKGNEPRLSALGLAAFVTALAVLLADVERRRGPLTARRSLFVVAAAVAVGSLHHLYTVVGPRSAGQFAALELLAGAVAGLALAAAVRAPRHPAAEVSRRPATAAPIGGRSPAPPRLDEP